MKILLACIGLAWATTALLVSYAEKQQEAALERLSSYKLKPRPAPDENPDFELVTAHSPYMREER